MIYRFAEKKDIEEVSRLRMEYFMEVYEILTESEKEMLYDSNLKYLFKELNKTCFVAVAENEKGICSCAYMNLFNKAANLRFINGVYGEVYGVYTKEKSRKRGYASELMKLLIEKGKQLELPFIELEASEQGYGLYKRLGFEEKVTNYRAMKYIYGA